MNLIENQNLPINWKEIAIQSKNDNTINKELSYVKSNWPKKIDSELKRYYLCRRELSNENGCLVRKYRVVIPQSMRKYVLQQIYSNYMSIVKMKYIARSYVWWPGLDKELENITNKCKECCTYRILRHKSELQSRSWPDQPWTRFYLDFFDPILNNMYFMVVIDAMSKWIECFRMNITSTATIN